MTKEEEERKVLFKVPDEALAKKKIEELIEKLKKSEEEKGMLQSERDELKQENEALRTEAGIKKVRDSDLNKKQKKNRYKNLYTRMKKEKDEWMQKYMNLLRTKRNKDND